MDVGRCEAGCLDAQGAPCCVPLGLHADFTAELNSSFDFCYVGNVVEGTDAIGEERGDEHFCNGVFSACCSDTPLEGISTLYLVDIHILTMPQSSFFGSVPSWV